MELPFIVFGAFLVLIIHQTVKADIPGCHFLETVNISSQSIQNGSYIYHDLEVPVNLTGEYNYITSEEGLNYTVKSHLRACVCQLKPCIWFCCRFKDWVEYNGECTDGLMKELTAINPYLNVTLSNGSVVKKNLLIDFIVLRDPMRTNDNWLEDEYTLFENGSILLGRYINYTMQFRGYDCFHPNQITSGNTEFIVVAFHQGITDEEPLPGAMELVWLSEVFLILTISVYLYEKTLRNLHGKCFICYMITTFMYFLLMLRADQIPSQLCLPYGYCLFFFVLTKFTWLLALSHQLWRGLTSFNRAESEYSFGVYSIFAWGTVAILTGLTCLMDKIWDGDPNKFKWISGMGWDTCFINWDTIITQIMLECPFLTLQALNTALFILTAINIMKVKLSLKYLSDQGERARNLSSRIKTINMVLRLLIVMDLQWSVRIIYMFTHWDLLLNICKYCDSCIGISIFVLFVLKRNTIRLLMESIRKGKK